MTIVTNNRADRAVSVRVMKPGGGSQVFVIPPKESKRIDGFDAKRKFNAALIEAGEISVGGGRVTRQNDDEGAAAKKAALTAAQTAFKNAKDALVAANKDAETDDTPENRKALSTAKAAFKKAENDLEAAQKDFDKG